MAHRRRHSRRKRSRRNIVDKSVSNSVSMIKGTSKKYMPKVKSGLENVGSKVVTTSKKSVPLLQNMTRKVLGMFGIKSSRRRR
jgi:hypothetical protein